MTDKKKIINRHKIVYMEPSGGMHGETCLFCLKYKPHEPSYKYMNLPDKEIREIAKQEGFSPDDIIKAKGQLDECRGQHYKGSGKSCHLCKCERLTVIETTKKHVNDYLEAGYKWINEHALSNDRYAGKLKQYITETSGNYASGLFGSRGSINTRTREHIVGNQYRRESEITYIMALTEKGGKV